MPSPVINTLKNSRLKCFRLYGNQHLKKTSLISDSSAEAKRHETFSLIINLCVVIFSEMVSFGVFAIVLILAVSFV